MQLDDTGPQQTEQEQQLVIGFDQLKFLLWRTRSEWIVCCLTMCGTCLCHCVTLCCFTQLFLSTCLINTKSDLSPNHLSVITSYRCSVFTNHFYPSPFNVHNLRNLSFCNVQYFPGPLYSPLILSHIHAISTRAELFAVLHVTAHLPL